MCKKYISCCLFNYKQDFTGVPAVVDFAAMRDAVKKLGGNPNKINPVCPSDLVIDHSIQADFIRRYALLEGMVHQVCFIKCILIFLNNGED